MFERFTSEARAIVVRAQQESRDLGSPYIGTEHVLLGMLAEDRGVTGGALAAAGIGYADTREGLRTTLARTAPAEPDPEALAAIGIDLEAVRIAVEESFGRGALERTRARSRRVAGRRRPRPGHKPFTPRAKKVLELSLREAINLGHNYIGDEHILLGLIREGEGMAALLLVRAGADLQQLRARVLEQLRP